MCCGGDIVEKMVHCLSKQGVSTGNTTDLCVDWTEIVLDCQMLDPYG